MSRNICHLIGNNEKCKWFPGLASQSRGGPMESLCTNDAVALNKKQRHRVPFYHIIRKRQPSMHAVNFTTDVLRDLQFDEAEQCKRSVILKDYNNFRLWNVHSPLFSRISMQLLNAGPDPPPRVLHDRSARSFLLACV